MQNIISLDRKPSEGEKAVLDHISMMAVVAYLAGENFAQSTKIAFGIAWADGKITRKSQEAWLKVFFQQAWHSKPYVASALQLGTETFQKTELGADVTTAQAVRRLKGIEVELAQGGLKL